MRAIIIIDFWKGGEKMELNILNVTAANYETAQTAESSCVSVGGGGCFDGAAD